MKQKKSRANKIKIILIVLLLLITTGCTTSLTDKNNKPVRNEVTGQNLTKNIICQPTNEKTRELYKKNKVNIDKLPKCKNFKITSGKYEGLWTAFFVKQETQYQSNVWMLIFILTITIVYSFL